MSILYLGCMYTYVNLSSESFIFFTESIYLCILLILLSGFYNHIQNKDSLYTMLFNLHYEQLYIYMTFLKKLNIKYTIIYRCFH